MYMSPGSLNSCNNNIGINSQRKKTRSWTEYEDQRLLAGIHKFGTDNWVSVASFVGNGRTRAQCSQRWTRGLDPRISKDKWSLEDEESLMRLVIQYGTKSWTRIAQEIGNRSDVQCRYHYKQMKQEMELDSDSSSGIANTNKPHLLNLQPSSISASNSATLPTLPNLFEPLPHNQHQNQNRSSDNNKPTNITSRNFMSSNDNDKDESPDSTPRKISTSGSLPACLSLALPRDPESNISPHFGIKFNAINSSRDFGFQQQFQNQNLLINTQNRTSNKVDLPSINDLLNGVFPSQQTVKCSMSPMQIFDNCSCFSTNNKQNNCSNNPNNNDISQIGSGNN